MVTEVSVHGRLTPLLWACGEANIMAEGHGKRVAVETVHLMVVRKQKEQE
jgi:hypothetical protein